ncbi:hypothetical protein ABEB36_008085 [Hypothenemus hampei]|uniref:Methylcytosine dioxygenase TET n=1 Tax=Hypothenemus hampei TaxID=57062 RepID=A0ABD1EKN5_HYPHA
MSETLSQDPDGLGVAYTTLTAPSYPSTPATPSSTVQDVPPGANLPPFSTFSTEIDSNGAFSSVSDRLFSDTRLLDISNWDYYTETRLVERGENGLSIITSQPQYRPWESKPVDSQVNNFSNETFSPQNGAGAAASKLPSFQSQFQAFSDPTVATTDQPTLTTLTNLTPVSPNSASSPQSQTLTTLNSSFHTLSARSYPLVPAPIQAREIPSIQQQFLDERHIQLYSHPTANLTLNNTIHSASIFPAQNGAIIQNNQIISSSPTVVTVLKSEPDLKLTSNLATLHQTDPTLKLQNIALHPTQFQNPMATLNSDTGLYNGIEKKVNGTGMMTSPTRTDFRKKERRKMRANSLESSAESDGASSNMDLGSESSGQVAAVSSTDGYNKAQHGLPVGMEQDISGGPMDKQVKKKRKRCGECIGCQRKDNCGDCAPCRNDKSHQICKQRRCEKLTEKKNLYGEPYMRGESRRGRGKGRGASSYRGRKPNGPITSLGSAGGLATGETNGGPVAPPQQTPTRPSPQPVTQPMPVQQQPMTPMPFYADPNRFPTPVWQTDPTQVSGWQGQFIQQIPTAAQTIDTYQQYPNGIYQATYQQPAFETNTFYTGAVQVLTPTNARPPSVPNQPPQMIPPRPNSNYSHTPSPSPANNVQQQQSQQQAANRQYQEYNQFGSNASNEGSQSRPSSVNSVVNQNPATPNNQNYQTNNQQQQQQQQQQSQGQQQTVYTPVSTGNFSPSSQQTQFANANSGNGQPGYPQVNTSSPQVVLHNSSGYPGNEQYGGQVQHNQWQESEQDWQNKVDQQHHYQEAQYIQNRSDNSSSNMANDNGQKMFSQADKVNLNTRIKTMILNKQQEAAKEQEMKNLDQNQTTTGHFLWYSHHQHLEPSLSADGGPFNNRPYYDRNTQQFAQTTCKIEDKSDELPAGRLNQSNFSNRNNNNHFSKTETSIEYDYYQFQQQETQENRKNCQTPQNVQSPSISSVRSPYTPNSPSSPLSSCHQKEQFLSPENTKTWLQERKKELAHFSRKLLKEPVSPDSSAQFKKTPPKVVGEEIPRCECFPPDQSPLEPGTYYTHLGCANNLRTLRYNLECQTGSTGAAIRIEKVRYTGKEGKTAQGCPIVKWVHRRVTIEEKYLVLVKHRKGHFCRSAFIVICLVVWEGVAKNNADELYSVLTEKLNKYGLQTRRRCATNDPRTCACQGIYEETCGTSFSFGCSWSMYYNGCKFTRSKDVRKFRLSVKEEESLIEEKLQHLADHVSPIYKALAPQSFKNQTRFEHIAGDCRLGTKPGKPFSGVTACIDFCAHAHKDIHNMNNGCTVVVTLTKHRDLSKSRDEQLHVLPLYVPENSDEFESKENQQSKILNGQIDVLKKYECEVRTFSEPAKRCKKNNGKKQAAANRKRKSSIEAHQQSPSVSEIQSGHVSSTVLDYFPVKSSYPSYRCLSGTLHWYRVHAKHMIQFSAHKLFEFMFYFYVCAVM